MMDNIQDNIHIFVVFHKYIFDECYKHIPQEILYKYFTFIAVNPKIEKCYTKNKYNIMNEWELPIYDSTFQERGYNENSAIYHIYINNLHKKYNYIGFFQYDMEFNDNIIPFLQENISQKPTLFYLANCDFDFTTTSISNLCNASFIDFIVKDYEIYFDKSFTKTCLYPLMNTYIIPIDIFEKTMKWVIQLYDKLYPLCIQQLYCYQFPRYQRFMSYAIGSIYERIMAYAIGEENLHCIKLNILHDHKYKHVSY
jgi:hypothetical protein